MKNEQHIIKVNDKSSVSSVWLIPEHYHAVIIIAHGSGNDMHSSYISFLHNGFAKQGIASIKFNFPYKEEGRKAPDRPAVLEATWQAVVDTVLEKTQCSAEQLFLSGKSMGGRYASIIARKQPELGGLIFFGYPLHSPGKPEKRRATYLATIPYPMLFIQGTRDALCDLDVLREITAPLATPPTLHLIVGGDHSFRILKGLERNPADVWNEVLQAAEQWISLNS